MIIVKLEGAMTPSLSLQSFGFVSHPHSFIQKKTHRSTNVPTETGYPYLVQLSTRNTPSNNGHASQITGKPNGST